MSATYKTIQLADAKRIIEAAQKKADEMKKKSSVAVVDAGGNLIAFERMDGAWTASITAAWSKARTAQAFNAETRDLFHRSLPGGDLFAAGGNYLRIPGGIPILQDGVVVGAVGVAGSKPDDDQEIACAAAAAF